MTTTDVPPTLRMERLELLRAMRAEAQRGMQQADAALRSELLAPFHDGARARRKSYALMSSHYDGQIAALERELGLDDPIAAIWQSVREGLITWQEARDLQASIVAATPPSDLGEQRQAARARRAGEGE